jgi:hypothetical protein
MIGLAMMLATASIASGNDLYASCKSSDVFDRTLCYGFVSGVVSGVQADRAIAAKPQAWCSREGVTNRQIIDIAVKFMEDDPSIRDQDAAAIVMFAMVGAFPCPKP